MTVHREGSASYNVPAETLQSTIRKVLLVGQPTYSYRIGLVRVDGSWFQTRIVPKSWMLSSTEMEITVSGDATESRVVASIRSPWFVQADLLNQYSRYINDFFQALNSYAENTGYRPPAKEQLQMDLGFNWQSITVFLLIGILIAAVGVRFHAFARLRAIQPIDHIAFNGKTICIHHDNSLYFLSPEGKLQQGIELAKFNLSAPPADLELLSDGSILLGDPETSRIRRCDVNELQCVDVGHSTQIIINDNYKFAVDEPNHLLYVADTNNHRLLAIYLDNSTSRIIEGVKLSYPNDLTVDSKGIVQISDTKNSRVLSLKVDPAKGTAVEVQTESIQLGKFHEPDSRFRNAEALAEKVMAGAVSSYPSPIALASGAGGERWLVVTDAHMNYGEVWVFADAGVRKQSIKLADGAIPKDIVQVGERLLVTDPEDIRLFSINPASYSVEPFGDAQFQAILEKTKTDREFFRTIKNGSFKILGALLAVLLLTLFFIKRKAKVEQSSPGAAGNKQRVPVPTPPRPPADTEQRSVISKEALRSEKVIQEGPGKEIPSVASPSMHTAGELPANLMLEFKGNAREYFRIWIVNLCLTLVSLGIFSAWAKVRKKRYFYSHLILDDTPFQYLGQPLPILKGRIIASALFLLYYSSTHFFTALLPYALIVGLVLAPWVIVQSVAFNARYSAYRNMTFRFNGTYAEALKVVSAWGIIPALAVGTMFDWWGAYWAAGILLALFGILFPWWTRRLRNFIITRTSFGGQQGSFGATGIDFFKVYFRSGMIAAGVGILAMITAAVSAIFLKDLLNPQDIPYLAAVSLLPLYAGYVLAFAYLQANLTNTVWNSIRLGPLQFYCTLKGDEMAKLYIVNAIGIILSAGLLIPWAAVRTYRYRIARTQIRHDSALTDFQGRSTETVQASGAELSEFFDMDLSI